MTPLDLAKELKQAIPDARLVTVAGGHFSLLTRERESLIDAVLAASE